MTKCWLASVTLVALVVLPKLTGAQSDADFDFGDEDSEFFSTYERAFNDHEFFPSDLSLGALDLISATPEFAKLRSYVDPSKVDVARSRRQAASSSEDDGEDDEEDYSSETSEEKDGGGDVEDYADRYDRFVSRHFKNRDEQRKKDEDEDDTDNGGQYGYRFSFSPSNDYDRIKQESLAQNRQLAKDPTNCKAFEKDGMLCNTCRDPATGTKSESCAYATIPQHKKYAYETQHSYNSKDRKPETEDEEESEEDGGKADREDDADDGGEDEIEETTTKASSIRQRTRGENISNLPQQPKVIPTSKPVVHLKPGQDGFNGGNYRYQPVDLRSNKERPPQVAPHQQHHLPGVIHPTYYDFYTHFYPTPHYSGLQSRSQKIRQQQEPTSNSDDVYVLSYRDEDQVAKVLADFESRDWSNCKKGNKNELTCYTCTDKNGVRHEECMYVSESRQVASKVLPNHSSSSATTTATTPSSEAATKPTKKPRRKKVHSEKKVTSPKLKKQMSTSAKLVQQLDEEEEPSEESITTNGGRQAQERQMVKRTISFKSHVDDSMAPSSDGERVMHYEHQVTHVL